MFSNVIHYDHNKYNVKYKYLCVFLIIYWILLKVSIGPDSRKKRPK